MKYLFSWDVYLVEQVKTSTDTLMDVSDIGTIENYEGMIKDFKTNKNFIRNIFLDKTIDEKTKRDKLKPFLKDGNINKMVFKNELLRIWSDMCNLERKKEELQQDLDKNRKQIEVEKQNFVKSDNDGKKRAKDRIDLLTKFIQNLEKEAADIEIEIKNNMVKSNSEMKNYNKKISSLKNPNKKIEKI